MGPVDMKSVSAGFREMFFLERAERIARSLSETQSRAMRAYFEAGMRRLRVAQDLRGPEEVQTSLSLYREATLLLAQAVLVARDANAEVTGVTVADALDGVSSSLPPGEVPADLQQVVTLLSSPDPLLFDRLPAEQAAAEAEKLERTAEWLASHIEPRTGGQIRLSRILRVGTTAVVVLSVLIWAIVRVTAPLDIAKGKPAVASSLALGTTAEAAVDGTKDGRFGLHTDNQLNASFTVDLGAEYQLSRIKVFGRGDCCYDQAIPLNLEVSKDGVAFQNIGQRTEAFSESEPWVVAPNGVVARHVRLRTERQAYLVLSEVEVYGKLQK
jgi:hypothetical protein